MTQCNSQLDVGFLSGKAAVGGFDGGDISSDGGLVLIAEVDRLLGLTARENSVSRRQLYGSAGVFLDLFVARHAAAAPQRIILDLDATDDETHGQQELAGFHGYYDEYCYLPLVVTAELDDGTQELLAFVLRPGRSSASRGAVAVLRRIKKRLRQGLPDTKLLLRGDSGFGLPEVYDWCEGQDKPVAYVLGLAQNSRLKDLAQPYMQDARAEYEETGEPVRRFHEFQYAAHTWPHPRRVILKAEVTAQGPNPRFVVTNMAGAPEELWNFPSPADVHE